MTLGVRVPIGRAEEARKNLIKAGMLDTERKVKREGDFVIFPAKKKLKGFDFVEGEFERLEMHKKFEDYLKEFLKPEEIQYVRTSFDIIGDIAVVEIPKELEKHGSKIAQSLLKAHNSIKTVLKKASEIKGEERVRKFEFLAGEKKTETTYREHGINLKLDIAEVYFSPRLSHERKRILAQVQDGEVIVDLFAGIGPFSILLTKYRKVKVYAIDINPAAYKYLEENVRINKVADKVVPLLGDCTKVAPRGIANRVIMNLPKTSDQFLGLAFDILKKGTIHFYSISPEQDLYGSKMEFIRKVAKDKGLKVKFLNKKIVRPYSPYHYHTVIDISVNKK